MRLFESRNPGCSIRDSREDMRGRPVFYQQVLGVGIQVGAAGSTKQSCDCRSADSLAGREFEIPGQAVVRKCGIWGWWGACWLLWRTGPEITWRRRARKEEEARNDNSL